MNESCVLQSLLEQSSAAAQKPKFKAAQLFLNAAGQVSGLLHLKKEGRRELMASPGECPKMLQWGDFLISCDRK